MAARRVAPRAALASVLLTAGLAAAVAQTIQPGIRDVAVAVELSCPSCAAGLERRLGRLDSVASVAINPDQGEVVVAAAVDGSLDLGAIRDVVRNAGFDPTAMTVSVVGRVSRGDPPTVTLEGEHAMPLAPDDQTDALVAQAAGQLVRITGRAEPQTADAGGYVLHVAAFEQP